MNIIKNTCKQINLFFVSSIASLLIASFFTPAWAGDFSITPVRIYMAPKDKAIAVTVTNEGDEELVMQADLYLWKQKPDGTDDLTLTEDIFLSPPIIKLAPKSRQVVRLARLTAAIPTEQLSYRMIAREIPEAKASKKDEYQLQIALAFSLPVFITPPNAKPKLECTVERVAAELVKAVCANNGNAHSHPTEFVLTSTMGDKLASQDSGAYLLAGITRSFDLKSTGGGIPAGKAKLSVKMDDATTLDYDVTIGN